MSSHTESPLSDSPVPDNPGSDIVEFLKLQGVQSRGYPGRLDDLGHRGVVEGPGPQRAPQYREMLVVPGRVVAQETDLIAGQPEVSLQLVSPEAGLPQAEALDHEHRAEEVDGVGLPGPVKDERGQRA